MRCAAFLLLCLVGLSYASSGFVCPRICKKTPRPPFSTRNAYKCADTASTPAQSRQICLYARNEKREHETGNLLCLSKRDNEFQQQNVAWDIQATYVLADGPSVNQGILVRLNDNKMLVPDIQCRCIPMIHGIQGGQYKLRYRRYRQERNAVTWTYDANKGRLFFTRPDKSRMCLAQDEGFLDISPCDQLKGKVIVMPKGAAYGSSKCAYTLVRDMIAQLGGSDGPYFWSTMWDYCVGTGLDDRSDAEVLSLKRIDGKRQPLWQIINMCRKECGQRPTCNTFQIDMRSGKCVLSTKGSGSGLERRKKRLVLAQTEGLNGETQIDEEAVLFTKNALYQTSQILEIGGNDREVTIRI